MAATNTDNTASTVEGYNVEYVEKSFTFAGELAAATVEMINIRKGEKVLAVDFRQAALGAGTQVEVGDGTDPNGYKVASTANTAEFGRGTGALLLAPQEYTADDTIDILTSGGAATGLVTIGVWIQRTFD